jgi:hypothetical protein
MCRISQSGYHSVFDPGAPPFAEAAQTAGAMREVSIDHAFAAEKGKLSLEFSDLEIES